jgi:ABC-type nitrate/sulfonate/bicarbonate transport system substrate-binding protein
LPPRLRQQDLSPNILPTTDVLDLPGVTLFTRKEVVENNPDVVDAFVRGWLQANRTFANDVDRVFRVYDDIASQYYDEKLNREALPTFYSALVPSKDVGQEHGKGWVESSKIQEITTILAENDIIEGSLSPSDAYTNRFIERNQDLAIETANDLYDRLEEYDVGPDFV